MVSKVFHGAKRSLFLLYFHLISLYYFTELPAAAGISTLFQSYFYLAIFYPKINLIAAKAKTKAKR